MAAPPASRPRFSERSRSEWTVMAQADRAMGFISVSSSRLSTRSAGPPSAAFGDVMSVTSSSVHVLVI
eukprot:1603671-Prorocentrum_lima.AAC.1